MALDRPAVFRTQIRALLRAANGRELRIILPMISDVSEFETARESVARYGGQLPDREEALRQMPGIGRYTAGAILSFAYGQDTAVLDTNVRRVLGLASRLPGLRRVDLHTNHRCAPEIVRRAARLVEHNDERFAKDIRSSPRNEGSVRLHERFGFVYLGTLERVGYKLGAWRDVGSWQRLVGPARAAEITCWRCSRRICW